MAGVLVKLIEGNRITINNKVIRLLRLKLDEELIGFTVTPDEKGRLIFDPVIHSMENKKEKEV